MTESSSHRRHRSRSRSPDHKHRSRRDRDDRSRSPAPRRRRERYSDSEDEESGPPEGVQRVDETDYYLKSNELRVWIDEEKGKRLDQLKSEDARKYFKKFCRAWNRGRLSTKYYDGISSASMPANISSGFSWNFSKASQRELDDASSIRKSIDTGSRPLPGSTSSAGPSRRPTMGPTLGPTMPPSAVEALQLARDHRDSTRDSRREEERNERKKGRKEERDEERDNRATGRDRLVEKRREVGANMREMKEAREGGGMVEVDDDTLMGGSGSSFKDMIAARDRSKTTGRRAQIQEERQAVMSDKMKTFRTKEDDTMAMFKALAAERFGPKAT